DTGAEIVDQLAALSLIVVRIEERRSPGGVLTELKAQPLSFWRSLVFQFGDGFAAGIVLLRDKAVAPREDAYIHVAARSVLPALILRPLIGSSVFLHALDIIARLFEHFDDLCAVVLKIQGGGRNVNARFSHLRSLGTKAAIWNDIS